MPKADKTKQLEIHPMRKDKQVLQVAMWRTPKDLDAWHLDMPVMQADLRRTRVVSTAALLDAPQQHLHRIHLQVVWA
jgi:hypothetical protein